MPSSNRPLGWKHHALFLGRGIQLPGGDGALKLKEISHIHAEGLPLRAELKHGPRLQDRDMPVVQYTPQWFIGLKSNLRRSTSAER